MVFEPRLRNLHFLLGQLMRLTPYVLLSSASGTDSADMLLILEHDSFNMILSSALSLVAIHLAG